MCGSGGDSAGEAVRVELLEDVVSSSSSDLPLTLLGRDLEGSGKAQGRLVEGSGKAHGRFMEGSWKAQGRLMEGSGKAHGRIGEGRSVPPASAVVVGQIDAPRALPRVHL